MSQATLNAPQRRQRAPEDLLLGFASIRTELLHTLTLLLGSPEDAQDALQETFLKCWKARHREERVVNFKAWIFRVGVNTARDLQRSAWKRKSRPLSPLLSPDDPQENSPPAQIVQGETIERIRQALTTLRAEEREVFLLRQNSDLTYDHIAQLRNVPVGTIKTQMRSALPQAPRDPERIQFVAKLTGRKGRDKPERSHSLQWIPCPFRSSSSR